MKLAKLQETKLLPGQGVSLVLVFVFTVCILFSASACDKLLPKPPEHAKPSHIPPVITPEPTRPPSYKSRINRAKGVGKTINDSLKKRMGSVK